MDKCIYHSRDLDGLTSAAIISIYTESQDVDCQLHPLDYGEKLDIRTFKGKTACMIDVSMSMDRMEALGKICNDFTWIDHHKSALDEFLSYCSTNGYDVEVNDVNSFIKRYSCKEMNINYYYSEVMSGCEITNRFYGYLITSTVANKLINALGQYDAWRDIKEKKIHSDIDWKEVLKIQYGMRRRFDVSKISKIIKDIDSIMLEAIISEGETILDYIKENNFNYALKNYDEIEFEGLKVVALNKEFPTGSIAFEDIFFPEVHDAMMAFCYNLKLGLINVSLYTTKDNIDILSIAKKYGGGGHKKACGFQVQGENINEFLKLFIK